MAVGLYLSRCGGLVGDVIDLDVLSERFSGEVDVVRVIDDLFDADVQRSILDDVARVGIEAIVLGGRSPDHHARSLSAPRLTEELVAAGINPSRVVYANLLEQVAWPHKGDPAGAAVKAEAVLEDALLKVRRSQEAERLESVPRRSVVVLGATPAGLVAAQRFLTLGYEVVLADRGGVLERLKRADVMRATLAFVQLHPAASMVDDAAFADGSGWIGDYDVTLDTPSGSRDLKVGAILLADTADAAWVSELRARFPLAVGDDGLLLSVSDAAHSAETGERGVIVIPPHDTSVKEVVAAADVATMAVVLRLSKPLTSEYIATSVVDSTLCGGCASCVRTCAFGACSIDPETRLSRVDPRRCHGCGKCVVSCPVGARDVVSCTHEYVFESIAALSLTPASRPKVLGFLCSGCGYPAADRAGRLASEGSETYPASFLPLRIPCGGRLDALHVLQAFKDGFDGVAVFRCREGHCRNLVGNLDMDRRINLLRTVLRSRNLDDTRLRIIDISPEEGEEFTSEVNTLFDDIARLSNGKGGPQ